MSLETRLGGDISPLRQALNEAKQEVLQFNAAISDAGSTSIDTAKSMDALQESTGRFAGTEGLERARQAAAEAARGGLDPLRQRLNEARLAAEAATRSIAETAAATDKMGNQLTGAALQERTFEQSTQSADRSVMSLTRTLAAAALGPRRMAGSVMMLAGNLGTLKTDAAAAGRTVSSSLLASLAGPAGLIAAMGGLSLAFSVWGDDILDFIRGNKDAAISVEELTKAAERFINLEGSGPSFEIDAAGLANAIAITEAIQAAMEATVQTLERAVPGVLRQGSGQFQSIGGSGALIEQAIDQVGLENDANAAVLERLQSLKVEAEVRERIERAAKAAGLVDKDSAKDARTRLDDTFITPSVLERIGDIDERLLHGPTPPTSDEVARSIFFGETKDDLDAEMRDFLDIMERVNDVDSESLAGHATTMAEAMESVTDVFDARREAEEAQIEATRRLIEAGIFPFADALHTVIQRLLRGESVSAGDVAGSFLSSVVSTGISVGVGALVTALTAGNVPAGIGAGSAAGGAYQGLLQRPDTSGFTANLTHRIQVQGSDLYIVLNEAIRQNNLPGLPVRQG